MTPSWSLLSYIPVSYSPKSLLCFVPAHPATSHSLAWSLTRPCIAHAPAAFLSSYATSQFLMGGGGLGSLQPVQTLHNKAQLHQGCGFHCSQVGCPTPSKETPSLVPSSLSHPADVLLPSWICSRSAALDIHVTSPLQQQTSQASVTKGFALQMGYNTSLPPTSQHAMKLGLTASPGQDTGRAC